MGMTVFQNRLHYTKERNLLQYIFWAIFHYHLLIFPKTKLAPKRVNDIETYPNNKDNYIVEARVFWSCHQLLTSILCLFWNRSIISSCLSFSGIFPRIDAKVAARRIRDLRGIWRAGRGGNYGLWKETCGNANTCIFSFKKSIYHADEWKLLDIHHIFQIFSKNSSMLMLLLSLLYISEIFLFPYTRHWQVILFIYNKFQFICE